MLTNITATSGTHYKTFKTTLKGSGYTILIAYGRSNYVSISKDMPAGRRGSLGKEFKTFTEAAQYYTSPEIKTALLFAEMQFNTYSKNN